MEVFYNLLNYFVFFFFICSVIGFTVSGTFLSVLYYPHTFVLGAIMLAANFTYLNEKNDADNSSETTKKKPVKSFVTVKADSVN